MTTQAHIIFEKEHEGLDKMLWINHDAFPEVIHEKLSNVTYDTTDLETLFRRVVDSLNCENLDNLFTIEPVLDQIMNYRYFIEVRGKNVYLRTEEEYWIEQEPTNTVPYGYLNSEMRTINVRLLGREDD